MLGQSKSLYSIADQLTLDPYYFEASLTSAQRYSQLKETLSHIKKTHNCLFFIDILLNHTAADSPWLNDDHDAYYSLSNTPHLNSAFLLDQTIAHFSASLSRGDLEGFSDSRLTTHQEVDQLVARLREKVAETDILEYH